MDFTWILHGFYLMNMQNMGIFWVFFGKKRSRRQWLMANGLHDQHQKEHMETTKRSQKIIDINTISIKGAIYHIFIYIYIYIYIYLSTRKV
jgi:hypothetical protein